MSVRIHQIAKKIGMENKDLLNLLQERGFAVKSVSSTIDNISADSLVEEFGAAEEDAEKAGGAEAAPEPPPSAPQAPEKEPLKRPSGPIVRSPEEVEQEKEAKKAARKAASAPTPPPQGKAAPPPAPPRERPVPPPPRPSAPAGPASGRPAGPPRPPSAPKPPGAPRPPAPPPRVGGKPPAPPPSARTGQPEPSEAEETAAPEEGESAAPEGKVLQAKPPIIVRDFAGLLGLKPFRLLSDLMERGIFASMNQTIDEGVAAKIAEAHGFRLEIRHRGGAGEPGEPKKKKEPEIDESALLEPRPPVVCVLGHVDHGKTTLLDTIRRQKVVEGEFGGITQHIGAYQVETSGERITFLDTPGHAAFARMRERGASTTDIAVLVVAADDGFKPQSDEALRFAQKAQASLVVAINKTDAKGANLDRVKQQMQERGIPPEDLGGDVITVPVSALKGEGIDQLLEMVRLQAEIMELKAVAKGKSSGVVIESQIEQGKGPTATILVQKGTLKTGDSLVCGVCSCKVRAMHDELGNALKAAPPSTPVKVAGWSDAPEAGSAYETVKNEREAKRIAEEALDERKKAEEEERLAEKSSGSNLDDLFSAIESTRKSSFRVILKADVRGSLEALDEMLKELPTDKIELEPVGRGVGMVTKKDVELAAAAEATIVGFNVRLENGVQGHAKHLGVRILQQNIIYEIVDIVREAMAELLEPESREKKLGVAEVRAVFPLGKGFVAGCMVKEGKIKRDAKTRLLRDGEVLHEGRIGTLKRFKEDATEVRAGFECGVGVAGFNGYREGDLIECHEVETVRPTL